MFRLLLIGVFHHQMGADSGTLELGHVLAVGFRYDISSAAAWATPLFLLSLSTLFIPWSRWLQTLRGYWVSGYVVFAILLFGVDMVYFHEYNDQFNPHLFGIVYDDTTAILITIWKNLHPLLFTVVVSILIALGLRGARVWMAYDPSWVSHRLPHLGVGAKTALGVILFFFFVALVRGGTLWGEPMRMKHAFVVDDMFLNHTVVTPFFALRSTLEDKLAVEEGGGLKNVWPDGDLHQALDLVRASRGEPPVSAHGEVNLDKALTVTAPGFEHLAQVKHRPRHIFVLLMESHSGWTVMPQYRYVGLSPQFAELADHGIYFPNFLPSGNGTIMSMGALLTGMPDAGLNINYEATSLKAYPSALAANFKRLGYRTRFFYGGFLGWQRLDSYAPAQGFDEVYGGGNMSAGVATNEWGVRDEYLFNYVLNKVDDSVPSLNFILSTSNHPPYDLPLDELGYHLKLLPKPLLATKDDTVKVLGHLWYADGQAGRFVKAMDKKLPNALFAITGDHTARLNVRFPGASVEEHVAVPFILYGPSVINGSGTESTAGSHLDIPATLIEMAAPSGFTYTRYGADMLRKTAPSVGYGYNYIIGQHFIADTHNVDHPFALAGEDRPQVNVDLHRQEREFAALQALSWERVRNGTKLDLK